MTERRVVQILCWTEVALIDGLLGCSKKMEALRERVQKFARTDEKVLIVGENGTGKELVAKALHALSSRKDKPLITVNCAAIPVELLESDLFGHERGAFTGAHTANLGRFERAKGGTLFLDEIGEMPISIQPKLLRAIEYGEIQRVGGRSPLYVDVRVIAATNVNLRRAVRERKFRADLLHRLSCLPIRTPPLRDRKEDIEVLLPAFLAKEGVTHVSVSPCAVRRLQQHSWPGNVRELENVVKRIAALLQDDLITASSVEEALLLGMEDLDECLDEELTQPNIQGSEILLSEIFRMVRAVSETRGFALPVDEEEDVTRVEPLPEDESTEIGYAPGTAVRSKTHEIQGIFLGPSEHPGKVRIRLTDERGFFLDDAPEQDWDSSDLLPSRPAA